MHRYFACLQPNSRVQSALENIPVAKSPMALIAQLAASSSTAREDSAIKPGTLYTLSVVVDDVVV